MPTIRTQLAYLDLDTMRVNNTIRLVPSTSKHCLVSTLHPDSVVPDSTDVVTTIRIGRSTDTTHLEPQRDMPRLDWSPAVMSVHHCAIWCSSKGWYIKDIASNTGTFLNYVRLSKPGIESPAYLLHDGDFIQLGQPGTHSDGELSTQSFVVRIESDDPYRAENRNSGPPRRCKRDSREGSAERISADCTICSTPILQSQASLTAPCNHMWHYGCMQRCIKATSVLGFLCPICLEGRLSVIAVRSSCRVRDIRHSRLPGKNFLPGIFHSRDKT
jgi:pSer/pThr/pTyr-binding forkhead associated (FHA) protein